jgi:hypothetical protein
MIKLARKHSRIKIITKISINMRAGAGCNQPVRRGSDHGVYIYRRDHDKYNLEILGVLRDELGDFLAIVFIFDAMTC